MPDINNKTKDTSSPDIVLINRKSPVPLYYQLAGVLEGQILSGTFKTNTKFPPEAQLIRAYGVSQPTVRQALGELVDRGLLVRERGRGTFVRPGANMPKGNDVIVKHHRLGLIMPWGPGTFFAPLLDIIEDMAHSNNFHLILANNQNDAQIEMAKARELLHHGIDGLFWMCPSGGPNEAFARMIGKSVPVVVAIDRSMRVPGLQVNLVEPDNIGGMKSLVSYLLKKGYRKIAMIREPGKLSSTIERECGYFEAFREAELESKESWLFISRKSFRENGRICAEKILDSGIKFDAIACLTDGTAIGAIHYLQEKSIKVPDDIAVTGFNDDSLAQVVRPQLTTAHIDVKEMGKKAIELLLNQLERLERGEEIEPVTIRTPANIVIRESA